MPQICWLLSQHGHVGALFAGGSMVLLGRQLWWGGFYYVTRHCGYVWFVFKNLHRLGTAVGTVVNTVTETQRHLQGIWRRLAACCCCHQQCSSHNFLLLLSWNWCTSVNCCVVFWTCRFGFGTSYFRVGLGRTPSKTKAALGELAK